MRILGIDPGYATIGFGLITAERAQVHMVTYGAITTPAGLPLSKRLYQIGTDMEELIGKLKPDVISIEELFFNTNLTTGQGGEAPGDGHDPPPAAFEIRPQARRRGGRPGPGIVPRPERHVPPAPAGQRGQGDSLNN